MLLVCLLSNSGADENYIGSPGNIPEFNFNKTPGIKQGHTGQISFTISNRYDKPIIDVNYTYEIFKLVTSTSSILIDDVDIPPIIVESNNQTIEFYYNSLDTNSKLFVSLNISTNKNTNVGTYFVRSQLEFNYNGSRYILSSRGHFTDEEWNNADLTAKPTDPDGINLTTLGVDGIIPDTSFKVEENTRGVIPGFNLSLAIIVIVVFLFKIHKRKFKRS